MDVGKIYIDSFGYSVKVISFSNSFLNSLLMYILKNNIVNPVMSKMLNITIEEAPIAK